MRDLGLLATRRGRQARTTVSDTASALAGEQ